MTITNGYASLEEFKARVFPAGVSTSVDDMVIEAIIEAVSRLLDDHCHRWFWSDTEDESRVYKAEWSDLLYCDDLVTLTSLKTDEDGDGVYEVTWSLTDYNLEPHNVSLQPYTRIRTAPLGTRLFPVSSRGPTVQLTGVFGWPEVPPQIREACLLQSARLFKRKDAPLGVIGSAELGQLQVIPKLDPDVLLLIRPLRRKL